MCRGRGTARAGGFTLSHVRIEIGNADEWADALSKIYEIPLALRRVSPEFRATLTHVPLSTDLAITAITSNGTRLERTQRLIRSGPSDAIFFTLLTRGVGAIVQDDRRGRLTPGAGVFYDASRPYVLDHDQGGDGLVFQITRRTLLGSAHDELPVGLRFDPAVPSLRILRAAALEIVQLGDEMDPHAAEAAEAVVVDLLRASLAGLHNDHRVAPLSRETLLRAVKATVADDLAEPELSPAHLASRHHISLRYLQSLFASDGSSPAAYIRELRLVTAHRRLGSVRYQHLPVSAIASGTGFSDLSTFTRAFRRRFGITPTERRAEAAAGGRGSVAKQWGRRP